MKEEFLRTFGIILIGSFILLGTGLYNGYPLVYSDTGMYIYSGFDSFVPADRPITYGLFVRHFSLKASLWFVIIAQSIIISLVMYQAMSSFFFRNKKYFSTTFLGTMLFLTVFTGASWYTSQIMPDIFTPLVLVIIPLLLYGRNLNTLKKILLGTLLLFSIITHLSHLVIATLVLLSAVLINWWIKKRQPDYITIPFRKLLFVGAFVIGAWIVLPTIHFLYGGGFKISKSSHIFYMGHLVDNGTLQNFLNENCDKPEYQWCSLCKHKDELPNNIAEFVWAENSVFHKTGSWQNSEDEYNFIIHKILTQPEYFFPNMGYSVIYGFSQLFRNDIGEGLTAYNDPSAPYGQVSWRFKNELNEYNLSKQNNWGGSQLNFKRINEIHSLLLILCCFAILIIISFRSKIDPGLLLFFYLILIGIFVNAMVTGGLTNAYERYQCRVIWLLPFLVMLITINYWDMILKKIKRGVENL